MVTVPMDIAKLGPAGMPRHLRLLTGRRGQVEVTSSGSASTSVLVELQETSKYFGPRGRARRLEHVDFELPRRSERVNRPREA